MIRPVAYTSGSGLSESERKRSKMIRPGMDNLSGWNSLENMPITEASLSVQARLQACHDQSFTCTCPDGVDLKGAVALVTGGNASIGLETARGLLRRGAEVIITSRDATKGELIANELMQSVQPGAVCSCISLDLANLETTLLPSLLKLKTLLKDRAVSILIENAGITGGNGQRNEKGYEAAFATNVLGHYVLRQTMLAQRLLEKTARIVIVTGDIYITCQGGASDWLIANGLGQLASTAEEGASDCGPEFWDHTYARSKLGNLWMAMELQRCYPDLHVVAVHPGVVSSNLGTTEVGRAGVPQKHSSQVMGAQTSLFAATQAVGKGVYLHNTQGQMKLSAQDPAMDSEKAQKLWIRCEELMNSN